MGRSGGGPGRRSKTVSRSGLWSSCGSAQRTTRALRLWLAIRLLHAHFLNRLYLSNHRIVVLLELADLVNGMLQIGLVHLLAGGFDLVDVLAGVPQG